MVEIYIKADLKGGFFMRPIAYLRTNAPWRKIALWGRAIRPFSFTASLTPVALGAALAASQHVFHPFLFLLTALGAVSLHAGTNLINDCFDFLKGVDTRSSFGSSGLLVERKLTPKQAFRGGLFFFAITAAIGIYLFLARGTAILALGLAGIFAGYLYTGVPVSYKYHALGVPMVFLFMGPVIVWGSYYVQTGSFSWQAIIAAIPIGFLVAAILHSNDLRDISHDSRVGIKTLSILLGPLGARRGYVALLAGSYLSLAVMVVFKIITPWALLALASLPSAVRAGKLVMNSPEGAPQLAAIDAISARLHLQFGMLFTSAVLLAAILYKG